MYNYKEGDVIYIKHMKFADSKSIDYRTNGRPYLVYKVEENKMFLFKIGSKKFEPQYFFSKVNVIRKYKKDTRECFVDMRYYIVVDAEKISIVIDSMYDEVNPPERKAKHGSKISSKDLLEVQNQVKVLEKMKEIKYAKISNEFAYVPNKKP